MSITVNLYYTGENGNALKFAQEMESSGTAEAIRREEGNLRYEYFQPLQDKETVLLIDSWESSISMMVMTGIFLPDIVKENLWQNHLHSRHCIEYERRHEVCSNKQQSVETYFVSFMLLRSNKMPSMTESAGRKFIRAVRYTTDNIYPSGQSVRRGCPVQ